MITVCRASLTAVALALFGCSDPLEEGCQYAQGLTKDCAVSAGGRWHKVPDGFVVERLNRDSQDLSAVRLVASEELRSMAGTAEVAQRNTLDALDDFLLRRYLLVYSDRGGVLDCVRDGKRPNVLNYLRTRDSSGYYSYLQLGAASKLSSRVFVKLFASAELKAKLEADIRSVIPNADSARAAANAAFTALRTQMESDKVVGAYRYLIVKAHPQVWQSLGEMGLLRSECSGKSVSQGVVAVTLDSRERLVEIATGLDLRVAVSAVVDSARIDKVVAATSASLSAEIRRAAERSIRVDLTSPVVVPLRWKPHRM